MLIYGDRAYLLWDVLKRHRDRTHMQWHKLLAPVVDEFKPPELSRYLADIGQVLQVLHDAKTAPRELDDMYIPLLRNAVIERRLELANNVEERRRRTIHDSLMVRLDSELEPYDTIISEQWFHSLGSCPMPSLTAFFPVEIVEAEILGHGRAPDPREYDEKFHILQAPSLFLPDIAVAREAAALRGVNTAVAYLDIDHFKAFNTETSESFVDRNVLPKFMRHLEAHVYMRGYAYRFGGDEYCILLYNVTEDEALSSMERLRLGLSRLSYESTQKKTTVSIGVVIVRPDCHLTGSEMHAANAAKNFAKSQGRNRAATYNSDALKAGDFRIIGVASDRLE